MAERKLSRRNFLASAAAGAVAPSLSELLTSNAEAGELNIRAFPRPHFRTYFGPRVGQTGTIMHWGNFTVIRPFHPITQRTPFQQQFVTLQPRQIQQRICEMPQPFLTTGYKDDNGDGLTTLDELRNLNENCYSAEGELIPGIYNLPDGNRYEITVRDSRGVPVTKGVGRTRDRIPAHIPFDLERALKVHGPGDFTAEYEVNGSPWATISFGLTDPEGKSLRGENNDLRWNQFDPRFPATFVSTGYSDTNGDGRPSIWEHDNPQLAEYSAHQDLKGVATGLCNDPVRAHMYVVGEDLKAVKEWEVDIGAKRTATMNIGCLPAGDYMFTVKYSNSDGPVYQEFKVVDKREVGPIAGNTIVPLR